MTFRRQRLGADEATARAIFHDYRMAGGNFIDTADICGGGESERLVGKSIAESGVRDEIAATRMPAGPAPRTSTAR